MTGDLDKFTGNMISNQPNTSPIRATSWWAMKKMIDGVYKVCKGLKRFRCSARVGSQQSLCPARIAVVGGALPI